MRVEITCLLLLITDAALAATAVPKPTNKKVLRAKPVTVNATGTHQPDELQKLSNDILKVGQEAEQLQTEVELNRQLLLESTKVDHELELGLAIPAFTQLHFRQLLVSIDGFPVYTVDENHGLWTGAERIPLYTGPIMPGQHEIRISAKVVKTQAGGKGFLSATDEVLEGVIPFTVGLDQKKQSITAHITLIDNRLTLDPVVVPPPAEKKHESKN